jgi:phage shock protein C
MTEPEPIERKARKLHRSVRDRVVAGVCGGLAEYLGVSPLAVRLVWILAIFWKGAGLLAYLLAVLLIPRAPTHETPPKSPKRTRTAFGVILVIIGVILLLMYQFCIPWHCWSPPADLWMPVALILIGAALLLASARRRVQRPDEPPPFAAQAAPIQPEGHRVRRSRSDRVLFGICGGIGDYYGMDPVLVRVIWVAMSLISFGFGFFVYLLLYFLIPIENPNPGSGV